jgi:hypothetical protein
MAVRFAHENAMMNSNGEGICLLWAENIILIPKNQGSPGLAHDRPKQPISIVTVNSYASKCFYIGDV